MYASVVLEQRYQVCSTATHLQVASSTFARTYFLRNYSIVWRAFFKNQKGKNAAGCPQTHDAPLLEEDPYH